MRIAEAPSFGQSIYDYAPRSIGAIDFEQLVDHIVGKDT